MEIDEIMKLSLDDRIIFLERLLLSLSEGDADFSLVVRLLEKSREEKSRAVDGVQATIDRVVKESSQAKEAQGAKGVSGVEAIAKTASEENKSDEKSQFQYRGISGASENANRYESKPYERKDSVYKKEESVDEAKKKADQVQGYARRG